MGNIWAPPGESFVLVPPKFSHYGLLPDVAPVSFVNEFFQRRDRRNILTSLHVFNNCIVSDFLIAPSVPLSTIAHARIGVVPKGELFDAGSLGISLKKEFKSNVSVNGDLCLDKERGISAHCQITGHVLCSSFSIGCLLSNSIFRNFSFTSKINYLTFGIDALSKNEWNFWGIAKLPNSILFGIRANQSGLYDLMACYSQNILGTCSSYTINGCLLSSDRVEIGLTQHLVTHRRVYNPLEDRNIKYIVNYIDIALEAASNKDGRNTIITAGASWQPNKNMLTKILCSTDIGLIVTVALRTWWSPSILLSVSSGIDTKGKPFFGGRFQVANWTAQRTQYERGTHVKDLPATLKLVQPS